MSPPTPNFILPARVRGARVPAYMVGFHGLYVIDVGPFLMCRSTWPKWRGNPKWGNTKMSDEQNPTPEAEPVEPNPQEPAKETDWRRHAKTWEQRAKDANAEIEELRKRAAKLDEYEEQQKSAEQKREEELEKLRTRATELERTLAEKDRAILVERVAASKGVPARYITGATEDELNASADQFLEDAKALGATGQRTGYVPSQGTGEPTPPATSLDEVRDRAKRFARK